MTAGQLDNYKLKKKKKTLRELAGFSLSYGPTPLWRTKCRHACGHAFTEESLQLPPLKHELHTGVTKAIYSQ